MPLFDYTALSPGGERVAGVLTAASEQAVLAELETRQLVPVRVAPSRPAGVLRRRVSARRLGNTYAQIGDLLRAGVPLLRALRLLGARRSQPRLAEVFRGLADDVAGGSDLAEAMSKHPEVFPRIHVAMVRAGEKGGFLEAVAARLGQFVLAQAELRSKIVGNLIYPALLVVFGAAVLSVIFGVFVPMFRPMFDRIQGQLPLVSRVVFAIADAVRGYGVFVAIGLGAAVFGVWTWSRRPGPVRTLARWRTRAPVLGPLVRALAAARFCRMLGTMLANGIPILASMQIAKDAAGNPLMEDAIAAAAESVRAGQPLAGPLGASGLFDDDVLEMIAVGEAANNLDEVLVTIAGTIEARIDRLLTTAVRMIEPLLLLVIGLLVVTVAAALILPITKLGAGF